MIDTDRHTLCVAAGDCLRERRKARGLTQRQLAKLANVEPSTLANLESGAHLPNVGILLRLAEAMGICVYELMGVECSGGRCAERAA